jgi:uncharacterized protein YndB with AHSA1/START domain
MNLVELKKTVLVDATISAVFRALDNPEERARWFPNEDETGRRLGGNPEGQNLGQENHLVWSFLGFQAEVLESVPDLKLSYAWTARTPSGDLRGVVTWLLDALPDGKTSATVVLSGIPEELRDKTAFALLLLQGRLQSYCVLSTRPISSPSSKKPIQPDSAREIGTFVTKHRASVAPPTERKAKVSRNLEPYRLVGWIALPVLVTSGFLLNIFFVWTSHFEGLSGATLPLLKRIGLINLGSEIARSFGILPSPSSPILQYTPTVITDTSADIVAALLLVVVMASAIFFFYGRNSTAKSGGHPVYRASLQAMMIASVVVMPLELEIFVSSPEFLFAPVTRFQLQSGLLKAFTNADVLILSVAFFIISLALLRINRRRYHVTALGVWALVLIGMLAWANTVPSAASTSAISPNYNCVLYNPPAKTLGLRLNATSASVGTIVSFSTSGWNSSENLSLEDATAGGNPVIWHGTTNSSGDATGVFQAEAIGLNSLYAVGESPFPHTGEETYHCALTVATPLPKSLGFELNATSVKVGAAVSFTTSGWRQTEPLVLEAFNQASGKYIQVWMGTADSSGNATGTFKVTTNLVGQNLVYVEDPTTPSPHTGYTTSQVTLTVTSAT